MKNLLVILLVFALMMSILPLGAFCVAVSAQETNMTEKGDANGDSIINAKDCVVLMQCITGCKIEIDTAAADINGDGKLNNKDYILLLRQINGWGSTVTPPKDDVGIELPMDKW